MLENSKNLTRLMNSICLHTIQFDLCKIQKLSFHAHESLAVASEHHCLFKKSYVGFVFVFWQPVLTSNESMRAC